MDQSPSSIMGRAIAARPLSSLQEGVCHILRITVANLIGKNRLIDVSKVMRMVMVLVALIALTTGGWADSSGRPAPKVKLGLYDVSHLVFQIQDFPSAGSIAEVVPEGAITDDDFAINVMKAIAPGKWGEKNGWSVQCQNGTLIVRAPTYIHQQLATSYLGGLKVIPLAP